MTITTLYRNDDGALLPQAGSRILGALLSAISLQAATTDAAPADQVPEVAPVDQALEQDVSPRLYRTNAERREAGRERQITPWLTTSTFAELDWQAEHYKVKQTGDIEHDQNGAATFQLGLSARPVELAKGELILEYDTDAHELYLDEAFVTLETDPWELEVGKLYLPFGVYLTNFATGPILELGETRAQAATLAYGPDDTMDFKLSAYLSPTHSQDSTSHSLGWSGGMELWPAENWSFGMSFLSDLADADGRPEDEDGGCCAQRVPGLSGYVVWVGEQTDLSFEALGALGRFHELDNERDRPFAWNLELAYFFLPRYSSALRLEASHEVEDEPRIQLGVAVTGRLLADTSLTLEFLHGRFEHDLATNDEDDSYRWVNRFGAQLSVAF